MSYLLAYPANLYKQRSHLQVRKKGRAINGLVSAAVAKGQESCRRSGMSLTGGKSLVKQIVAVRVGLVCRTFGFNHCSLNHSLNHAVECWFGTLQ
jgi:hypothetical protein